MILALLLGCARTPPALPEPVPTTAHAAAEAAAARRVRDPARGGPPIHPSASPLPPFTHVDRGTATYVGAPVCSACHPTAAQVLADSAHAHSVQTLRHADRSADPRCLRCHVTGLGHPGGFGETDAVAGLAQVGCEACHGPGRDHLRDTEQPYGRLPGDGAACVGCHTHDNSPDYRWDRYWPRIAHGTQSDRMEP